MTPSALISVRPGGTGSIDRFVAACLEMRLDFTGRRVLDLAVEAGALAHALNRAGVEVGVIDETDLPGLFLEHAAYDVVTTSRGLHGLPASAAEETTERLYDRLRPGGLAAIRAQTAFAAYERIWDVTAGAGVLPYSGASWIMLLRCAGFDVVDVRRLGPGIPAEVRAARAQALAGYDPIELDTAELVVFARRPERPFCASLLT